MLTVDIKSLLMRLNDYSAAAMQSAAGLCVSRTHYEITIEHLIAKLFDNPMSDWPLAFSRLGADTAKVLRAVEATLEEFRTGNAGKPVFSPLLLELIQDAWLISSIDLEERKVRSGPFSSRSSRCRHSSPPAAMPTLSSQSAVTPSRAISGT
jgi:type VI secretion system protein VasG